MIICLCLQLAKLRREDGPVHQAATNTRGFWKNSSDNGRDDEKAPLMFQKMKHR